MAEDREALKAKLEAELAELRKDAGDSEKDAKKAVEAVKADAEDEVAALEAEARKLRVERAADPAPNLERRDEDRDNGESLEQNTGLEHAEGNHGPDHELLPGDPGDTHVLYKSELPEDPALQNRNLRELSVEDQAKRRGL